MKLESEMAFAKARPLAENIAVEMIVADATSFAMELTVEMVFAETRPFVESIADEMTVADATHLMKSFLARLHPCMKFGLARLMKCASICQLK